MGWQAVKIDQSSNQGCRLWFSASLLGCEDEYPRW